MKITITVLLASLFLLNCSLIEKISKRQNLTILSATSQKWHGGAEGSASGTTYIIKAIALTNDLVVDSLFLPNYSVKLIVSANNKDTNIARKRDTLVMRAVVSNKMETTTNNIKGAVQIKTTTKKGSSKVTVEKIETLKPLCYP